MKWTRKRGHREGKERDEDRPYMDTILYKLLEQLMFKYH